MSDTRIAITPTLLEPAEFAHFEGELNLPVVKAGPDFYSFNEPLTWQVDISNTGDALLVMGTVESITTTSCARCLGDYTFPVTGEIEGYFLLDANRDTPEDMDDDEFEVLPADRMLDLEPLVVAALLIEFPLIPLCDDECKGLCSQCGTNLNEETCECSVDVEAQEAFEEALNPFSALKDFKVEDK